MRPLLLSLVTVLAAGLGAKAEEVGDPQAGFEYAEQICSVCHGISSEQSPLPEATRFREVADRPGMTTKTPRSARRCWRGCFGRLGGLGS